MAVPSSKRACQSPWPRSGRLVKRREQPVRDELDLDDRRGEPARVGERPDRPAVEAQDRRGAVGDVAPSAARPGGRVVDAAPTTVASPTSSRARSYRWVACSMTWPPPSSARPHQAGPGVESSQRATTSCGGAPSSQSRGPRPGCRAPGGGSRRRRRARPARSPPPAGPDRRASAAASGFSVRNGMPACDQPLADRHRPVRRHGDVDDVGLRLGEHRVDVVVARAAPAGGDRVGRSRVVRATTPTSSVRPSRSSASRWSRLIQPPPTSPSRTRHVSPRCRRCWPAGTARSPRAGRSGRPPAACPGASA